jgi:hypothetical protein
MTNDASGVGECILTSQYSTSVEVRSILDGSAMTNRNGRPGFFVAVVELIGR